MAGKNVLITGGAGFVGCHLADRMIRAGHAVTVFDNLYRPGAQRNLAWLQGEHGPDRFRTVTGDIREGREIEEAARGAQVIFHVAAQTAVTTSVRDPRGDFEINALGTFNTLEAARRFGDDPVFIVSSTNKVYGGMEDVVVVEEKTRYRFRDYPRGIDESRPLDFHSPYGCSKGAADQYVRDYARIYGLRSVVFRMSSIYGPHQWGNEDQAWVAWFVIQATTGRPITIYGNGKQVRDVLYVDDLVDAFQMAAERIDVTAGQIYNIGGGPEHALSIWAEFQPLLSRALGREVEAAGFGDWRPGDQPIYISDTAKAEREFGWRPRIGIEEGLGRLVRWACQNREAF
jgi:CDP-paratose 2-epimerase